MKKILILLYSVSFFSCSYSNKLLINEQVSTKIVFEYVDIYTTTPIKVEENSFNTFFGSSVKKVTFSGVDSTRGISKYFKEYFKRATKFSTNSDVRIIVKFFNHGTEATKILIGSSIVTVNNDNFIIDEQLIKNINKTLAKDW
jgi:hypothetical protein